MSQFRIAIDFDGTIVEHKYPDLGREAPGAFRWLKEFKEANAFLMLWTMRSDCPDYGRDGPALTQAIELCRKNGVTFDLANHDPVTTWTTSPKLDAHLFIDDRAFGCPVWVPAGFRRPVVDWNVVGPAVLDLIKQYNDAYGIRTNTGTA